MSQSRFSVGHGLIWQGDQPVLGVFMEEDNRRGVKSIFIDKEGRWFYKGLEMVRRDIVLLFYGNLHRDRQGQYLIRMGKEESYLEVEDTPFVISRVDLRCHGEAEACFHVWLNDDSREVLNLDTLSVGKGNVLYCSVKEGAFPARFQRPAYYQLSEHVQEENGKYLISLNGKRYLIHQEV